MSYYATQRLSAILDHIQELHAEARAISLENGIPFNLPLATHDGYEVDNHFNRHGARAVPTGWHSSNC